MHMNDPQIGQTGADGGLRGMIRIFGLMEIVSSVLGLLLSGIREEWCSIAGTRLLEPKEIDRFCSKWRAALPVYNNVGPYCIHSIVCYGGLSLRGMCSS